MSNDGFKTIDQVVPNLTSQVFLKGAMRLIFPDDRQQILQYLIAFASAFRRYSRAEINTRALQHYFQDECGWTEFKSAWYRVRIDEALIPPETSKKE